MEIFCEIHIIRTNIFQTTHFCVTPFFGSTKLADVLNLEMQCCTVLVVKFSFTIEPPTCRRFTQIMPTLQL